ncbi:MAG: succinate dehydrogenase, cytochrome b556 subunit [Gammaproteobacteria bacterium]|nr:succinate dehydrogenase, cytochrome b556 subunit [Gammaproteobacteria bacterium]
MHNAQQPLSPHLQIYKPQLTSVLSITHRATGVFLTLGAFVLCYWLLALAAGPDSYATLVGHLDAWYGRLFLVAILFSLYFHLCNGVRHLFWDAGLGFGIRTAYASGYAVIAASILLSVATLLYGGIA